MSLKQAKPSPLSGIAYMDGLQHRVQWVAIDTFAVHCIAGNAVRIEVASDGSGELLS